MVIFHSYVSLPESTLEYARNAGCSWASPHHSREMDMTWVKSQWNRREIRTIFKLQGQQTNQFIKNFIYWKTITKRKQIGFEIHQWSSSVFVDQFLGMAPNKTISEFEGFANIHPSHALSCENSWAFPKRAKILSADSWPFDYNMYVKIYVYIYIYIHIPSGWLT